MNNRNTPNPNIHACAHYDSDDSSEDSHDEIYGRRRTVNNHLWSSKGRVYRINKETDYSACVEPWNDTSNNLHDYENRHNDTRWEKTKERLKKLYNDNNKPKLTGVPLDDDTQFDIQITENDNEKECSVCMDNKPICIISPCNHKIICVGCSIRLCKGKEKKTVNCPQCRTLIKSIGRVFE